MRDWEQGWKWGWFQIQWGIMVELLAQMSMVARGVSW